MKKVVLFVVLLLSVLMAFLSFNALRKSSKQLMGIPPIPEVQIGDSAVNHLAEAIRIRTVSYQDIALMDSTQFDKFIGFLAKTYPLVHSKLKLEKINSYSLLFRWEGKNAALKPAILMGHYDVVPVIQGTGKMWKNLPFAGEVSNGFVYGRGTLDDKSTVIGLLEAVELLLKQNFTPNRTLYFAFGHDEEISGTRGAKYIAKLLEQRKLSFEYVIDEGGTIKIDGVGSLKKPVALIGIAEKGYTSLQLTAVGEGGHSSMPPKQTSIGMLSAAINKLQENPFPSSIQGATSSMFDYLVPEMAFSQRLVLGNRWLFSPLVKNILEETPSGNASIRTTTSPTIFNAGIKDNVLPIEATATINFRILPGDSVQGVINYVTKIINNDKITVESLKSIDWEPSPISDTASVGFRLLHKTIKGCFPNSIVAPYLVVGATDARYYRNVSKNLFRFAPIPLNDEDLKRPHGTNERLAAKDFKKAVQFYAEFIRNE